VQAEYIVAGINLAQFLTANPGMPDPGTATWTLSFRNEPGSSDAEKRQRVDEVACWLNVQPEWRHGVYFAQRDMGNQRLILDAHFVPRAAQADIWSAIQRGELRPGRELAA
jgi:hypothetical protein